MSVAHVQCRWSHKLLALWSQQGVSEVVLSAGSRHTPLVLAAHGLEAEGHLRIHNVLDERVAGFVALGLSRITGTPALVIEAERSRIPLIVITADRPQELHGVGAPQTIEQEGLFGVHSRGDFAGDPLAEETHEGGVEALASALLSRALSPEPGPVHLNVAFKKPLWEAGCDELTRTLLDAPAPLRPAGPREITEPLVQSVEEAAKGVERGLILLGPGDPSSAGTPYATRRDALARGALELGQRLAWPVCVDGASAGRLAGDHPYWITSLESLLRAGALSDVHPELIVRVGQVATSTRAQEWLATRRSRSLQIDPAGRWQDPARVSEAPLEADPCALFTALTERLPARSSSEWIEAWVQAESLARGQLRDLWGHGTEGRPGSSGATLQAIVGGLRSGGLLHVASSLPIRDLDAFSGAPGRRIHVSANRGANGIDGTIATALGEAMVWEGPTVALLGDLALSHDLGALAACRLAAEANPTLSLTLVVLDNGGGGIFDELPITAHPSAHERHFITDQKLNISEVARAFGLTTLRSEGKRPCVSAALAQLMERPGVSLLHVVVDRKEDAQERRAAHEAVAQALNLDANPFSRLAPEDEGGCP